jgi:Tol biopolymer transport system component
MIGIMCHRKTAIRWVMLLWLIMTIVPSYMADADSLPYCRDHSPVWSPSGDQIAFVSERLGDEDIWLMDQDGGNVRNLSSDLLADDVYPRWSPDGNWVSFLSIYDDRTTVRIVNADGNGLREIVPPEGFLYGITVWSHDSQEIAVMFINSETRGIKIINLVNDEIRTIPSDFLSADNMVRSADDKELFAMSIGYTKIVILDIEAEAFTAIPIPGMTIDAAWSPGLDKLALITMPVRTGDPNDLYVYDWKQDSPINLTPNHDGDVSAAAWSHDGSQIAFVSDLSDFGQNPNLWVMEADGSLIRRVIYKVLGDILDFDWSPDDEYLAVAVWRDGVTSNIWRAKVDGTELINLSNKQACN